MTESQHQPRACGALRPAIQPAGWICDGTGLVKVLDGPAFGDEPPVPIVAPEWAVPYLSAPFADMGSFEGGDHIHAVLDIRRRGVVRLNEDDVAAMLRLRKGQRVVGMWPNPPANSIDVGIEGEGLPVVEPGMEAPHVPADPYVDLRLRQRLVQLLADYDEERHGHEVSDFAERVRRVLAGDLTPLADSPLYVQEVDR